MAEGDLGYYCDSLKVNGKELTAAANGTYSFVATETIYEVSATFAEIPDEELFYTNNQKSKLPDPFVLDNTSRDEYYYMYGTGVATTGAVMCWRSTNLMDWDVVGYAIDKTVSDTVAKTLNSNVFAPEVVYDDASQTYYMFFSAQPDSSTGNEQTDKINETFGINATYVMMVAESKSPDKDYTLVDMTKYDSDDRSEETEYYANYSYFNPAKLLDKCNDDKTYSKTRAGYVPSIDPHPYEDETGKYLFWVDQENDDRICAIKMLNDNWLTPDWDTFTVVTKATYKTVNGTETVSYDSEGGNGDYYINEAPEIIKHNGKYYLTYSTGAYAKDTYQVIQAVAEPDANGGPLGTYTKLTEDEGAILLSSKKAGNTVITGAGHHSFVTAGDKLYMVYHRHITPYVEGVDGTGGNDRSPAIDEVKWITNSNDLPIMYVNGATSTLQPRLDGTYKNIADKDGVTVLADKTVGSLDYLRDGLLSINNNEETTITEETTFTFNFDSAREVRGIMVYNSKNRDNIFTNISKIELVYEQNGVEVTRTFENIAFNSEYYTEDSVTLGAAACAKLAYMNVKSISITVDVPEGQSAVGISEIRILGK